MVKEKIMWSLRQKYVPNSFLYHLGGMSLERMGRIVLDVL